MIITRITADNVLKYSHLALDGLPQNGMVAVAGQNESGKSSIGEIICFALFGRTFSYGPEELEKIIGWGQTRCSAALDFVMQDGRTYQVSRLLDNDGNQGARLQRTDMEAEPIASGTEAVTQAMQQLLGYDFEEFIESFYLAQREISTPHRHSRAVKAMAGLSAFEAVADECEQEIREAQLAIDETPVRIAEMEAELEALNIQEGRLAELEAQRGTLEADRQRSESQVRELKRAGESYEENRPRLAAARRGRNSSAVVSGILILATLGSIMAAWAPEVEQARDGFPWGVGAWVFGIMFLFAVGRLAIMNGRIEGLEQAAAAFAARLEGLPKAAPQGEEMSLQAQAALYDRIGACAAEPEEVQRLLERILQRFAQEAETLQGELTALDQEVSLERERVEKAAELQRAKATLQEQVMEQQQRISLRRQALELLAGAGRHLSQRFNRDLRDLVGRTLPLFTEGRYAHLKIDEELNVQVFSNEKRDFMQLEEVSSGTQRQIMLAVRLALSQKLVDSAVGGRQFVFLDEPFAFFDQERTRSALAALPNLSDEITQIWIVAQEFPVESRFDYFIQCQREHEGLTMGDDQGLTAGEAPVVADEQGQPVLS